MELTKNTKNDPTPDESLVPVFSSSNHDGETEAMIIKGILEASGVPAFPKGLPVLLPTRGAICQKLVSRKSRHVTLRARATSDSQAKVKAGSSGPGDGI